MKGIKLLDIKSLVEGNALAFASVDSKGKPHCIAVGYAKVVGSDKVLISDNYMVETVKNIKHDKNVALAVFCSNWKEKCEGYELKGTAKYFARGSWKRQAKSLPENKNEPCKGAIVVTVKKIKKLA